MVFAKIHVAWGRRGLFRFFAMLLFAVFASQVQAASVGNDKSSQRAEAKAAKQAAKNAEKLRRKNERAEKKRRAKIPFLRPESDWILTKWTLDKKVQPAIFVQLAAFCFERGEKDKFAEAMHEKICGNAAIFHFDAVPPRKNPKKAKKSFSATVFFDFADAESEIAAVQRQIRKCLSVHSSCELEITSRETLVFEGLPDDGRSRRFRIEFSRYAPDSLAFSSWTLEKYEAENAIAKVPADLPFPPTLQFYEKAECSTRRNSFLMDYLMSGERALRFLTDTAFFSANVSATMFSSQMESDLIGCFQRTAKYCLAARTLLLFDEYDRLVLQFRASG